MEEEEKRRLKGTAARNVKYARGSRTPEEKVNTRRSNFARASTARWEGSSECTHRWDRTTAKFALSQHVARRDKCEPGRDGLVKRVASQSPFAAVVLTEPLHDLLWRRQQQD